MTASNIRSVASRSVVLVADDFALIPGVDRAVADLAGLGRLSATSAVVTKPDWPASGETLASVSQAIAIGLHINLTEGKALSQLDGLARNGVLPALPTLLRLLTQTLTPSRHRDALRTEIAAQVDRFIAGTGRPPDHIDGHQHVHALPAVRHALFDVLAERSWGRRVLLRDCADTMSAILARRLAIPKSLTIAALASGFSRQARQRGYLVNDGFSGITQLQSGADVTREFANAFSKPGPRHMVMCHPGQNCPDALGARRAREYHALMSMPDLPQQIFVPTRARRDGPVNWRDWLDTPEQHA